MSETISAILQTATKKMISISDTALLDAEILLAHVLQVPRAYLYAWPEKKISENQKNSFDALIERRIKGEPVPYIIGHQEFWSMDFIVTPDTLIPRPETELVVELVLNTPLSHPSFSKEGKRDFIVADLGTGSGAIALAIAHERPDWMVYATDQSPAALSVAKSNAEKLKIQNVLFFEGSWCKALPQKLFDVIVSNPPYIAEDDIHLTQNNLRFEPRSALASGKDGLNAIREIIHDAQNYLISNGCLMLEHGYGQAADVRNLFKSGGYENVHSYNDLSKIERVTIGFKR